MTRATCKKRRYYDYDEPRGLLPRPKRSSAIPPISQNGARGWWVGGEWIEERPAPSLKREYRTRVSPVVISDDEDSDCLEVLPPIAQNANASRASPGTHFDFNDCQQTLPWAKTPNERSCRAVRPPYQCLGHCRNAACCGATADSTRHVLLWRPQTTNCSRIWTTDRFPEDSSKRLTIYCATIPRLLTIQRVVIRSRSSTLCLPWVHTSISYVATLDLLGEVHSSLECASTDSFSGTSTAS